MKKSTKRIIVITILIIWIILIILDCNRLNNFNNNFNLKPLITIMSIKYNNEHEYGTIHIGLGYSVKHFNKSISACGTIVYLFYLFPLPYITSL